MNGRDVFLAMVSGFTIIFVGMIFGGKVEIKDTKMNMDRAEGYVQGGQAVKEAFEAELASDSPLAGLARVDQHDFQALREEVKALSKRVEELTEELKKLKESQLKAEIRVLFLEVERNLEKIVPPETLPEATDSFTNPTPADKETPPTSPALLKLESDKSAQ